MRGKSTFYDKSILHKKANNKDINITLFEDVNVALFIVLASGSVSLMMSFNKLFNLPGILFD